MKETAKKVGGKVGALDGLNALLRARVRVETAEGVVRVGILSGIVKKEITIGECVASIPVEIELDHDHSDTVATHRIKSIRKVEKTAAKA